MVNFRNCQIKFECTVEINKNILKFCSLDQKDKNSSFASITEDDETITIWNFEQRKPDITRKLVGHTKPVTDLLFYKETHSLISSSLDKTIKIWDTDNGALLKTLKKHEDGIFSLVLLNDLYVFCSSAGDKNLQFWDIETFEPKMTFKIDTKISKMIYINTEENKYSLVCGCKSGFLYWLVNAETLKVEQKKKVKAHNSGINHLFYVKTNKTLLSCANDKSIKIWDISTKDLAKEIIIHEDIIIPQIFYDNYNDIIVCGSSDGFIRIIKIKDYKVCKEFKEELSDFGGVHWVNEKSLLLISGKQKQKNNNQTICFMKARQFI